MGRVGALGGLRYWAGFEVEKKKTLRGTETWKPLKVDKPTQSNNVFSPAVPKGIGRFRAELTRKQSSAERVFFKLLALRAGRKADYLYLNGKRFKFSRQQPIYSYYADFCCHKRWLVIEIDGKTHETPEAKKYDAARDEFMQKLGWDVLRIPAWYVYNEPRTVIDVVHAVLSGDYSLKPDWIRRRLAKGRKKTWFKGNRRVGWHNVS